MIFSPLGDGAIVVTLGASIDEATLGRVRALAAALEVRREPGVLEVVPAYATVTVVYDPAAAVVGDVSPYDRLCRWIGECATRAEHSWPVLTNRAAVADERRVTEIPVCYGGEYGPDLEAVAQHCGLKTEAVTRLHAGADYRVHAVGFAPGFPYLGGLPAKLRTPRRPTPRTSVPAGSVGIGWEQTGVYPVASPGGWQLIGRTPLALFRAEREPPALLRVGERVKFRAITPEEFAAWK